MPVLGLKFNQARSKFFDRQPVINSVNRAERRVLSKFGAFVRRGAKSSIRQRKSVSKPGQPPSSHSGLLRKTIFFVYEPARKSVVIGPIELNRGTQAPQLLEHGGSVVRRQNKRRIRMVYRLRPFMGPALKRELPKLPAMWRDSVR